MDTILFLSKAIRRLHLSAPAFGVLSHLPVFTPPRSIKNVNASGALELCQSFYPDRGESCLCGRTSPRNPQYDLEIIIPVYNVEAFVAECVQSVLDQDTKFTFHVTIVNDGSTDGSRKVLEKFESDRRVTIIDQENKGHSGSRNTGLAVANGRYICFVDSDDKLPRNSVELLMSKAVEGDYDIVGGGFTQFNDRFGTLRTHLPRENQLSGFPWGKVYKASVWDNVQFPPNYLYEDRICDLVIHARAVRRAAVPQVIYNWRRNTGSITFTSNGNPKSLDIIYVTRTLLADRQKLGLPFDEGFYGTLLHQCSINAWRVYTVGNAELNYANFVLSRDWFNAYRRPTTLRTKKAQAIEKALAGNDYNMFLLASLFFL